MTKRTPKERTRVLVVDDELAILRLMKLLLEGTHRYKVRAENDSRRALDAALEFQPDIVLLDIVMPEIDGGEVASLMGKTPALTKTPILFISALASAASAGGEALGTLGGWPVLPKPARIEEVMRRIDQLLAA